MSGWLAFARPWVLAALALLPLYLRYRWSLLERGAVPFAPLQYRRPGAGRRRLATLRLALEAALLAVVVVGLAGPYRGNELELIEEEGIDVVLALDISLSMLAEDFPPNRLEALREIARDFVTRGASDRIGVVTFARDSFVHVPLTTDHQTLLQLLDDVSVKAIDQRLSGGTAVGDALLVAAEHLARSRIEGRDQALVLITDGESNLGSEPAFAARYAGSLGIKLYAVGVGGTEPIAVFVDGERLGGDDPYLAVLDEAELEGVAAAAGGHFYRAADRGALEQVFGELSRLERKPLEVRRLDIRRSRTPPLAASALALFGLCLLLGGVVLRRPYR